MIGGDFLGLSVRLLGEFPVPVQGSHFDTLDEEFDSNNEALLTNPLYFYTSSCGLILHYETFYIVHSPTNTLFIKLEKV